jgi:tRNA U34 5-methylaminomethyl-2-thiouridine-forming methyltransferase MnmC
MTEYVTTDDGTITLLDPETGELYHNRAGAYTEALRNYVEPSGAINRLKQNHQLDVLDVCFGLGYNTFVLLQKALQERIRGFINVVAIESDANAIGTTRDVLRSEHFAQLCAFFGSDSFATKFHQISSTFAGLQISIDIRQGDLRSLVPSLRQPFDLVFHDPFSPRKVPELWTQQLFEQYRRLLNERHGMMLTYSSAGAVRGGLMQAGFEVFRTAAVGAKPGGTLASVDKTPHFAVVENLSDEEFHKLHGKSGIPYRDDNFSRSREDVLRIRESEQANP